MLMKNRLRCFGSFLKAPAIACLMLILITPLSTRAELLIRITEGARCGNTDCRCAVR